MDLIDNCLVEQVQGDTPVTLIDSSFDGPPQLHQFTEADEMEKFLNSSRQSHCRIFSICQKDSWSPLQFTKPMANLIASKHALSSSFCDILSCFYKRRRELEETFATSFSQSNDGPWRELSYSIRYPESKQIGQVSSWAMRQSAILHRFNMKTNQSVFVLVNPTTKSAAFQNIRNFLGSCPFQTLPSILWLHDILLSTHLPSWRQYLTSLEDQVLEISNTTFSSFIDEELRIGYDSLNTITSVGTKGLKAANMLESTHEVLENLETFIKNQGNLPKGDSKATEAALQLRNKIRQCATHSRTAGYIQKRCQTTAQLISDTHSFREQLLAKEQNNNMLRLNKSVVFITTLTLLYLPASFVASFFGMSFFSLDEQSRQIICAPMIWIYVISTAAMTGLTLAIYYLLLHQDSALVQRLVPKVTIEDIKTLKRQLTGISPSKAV